MKKLIMVLVAAASVGIASAQKVYKNTQDKKNTGVYAVNQHQSPQYNAAGNKTYAFNAKERDAKIRQIKMEYEAKILAVKKNRHLRPSEKQKQINWLQNQQDEQVQQLNDRFYSSVPAHNNHYNNKKW